VAAQRPTVAHGPNGHRAKIRASGVSFFYGRFRALHDVSLTIALWRAGRIRSNAELFSNPADSRTADYVSGKFG
jgi:ABC-type phosphate transport system ATPase subunit